MTNSLYIATTGPYSGKSLVSLGIVDLLLRRTSRVGIFRPIIGSRSVEERDKNIDLLLTHYNLGPAYEDTYGLLMQEAVDLIGQGRYDEVLDRIIERYKALEGCCDFILCIGSDLEGETAALEFDFNADVAKNLGCPVLLVASGANRDVAGRCQYLPGHPRRLPGTGRPGVGHDRQPRRTGDLHTAARRAQRGTAPGQRHAVGDPRRYHAEQPHPQRGCRAVGCRDPLWRGPTRQAGTPATWSLPCSSETICPT